MLEKISKKKICEEEIIYFLILSLKVKMEIGP